MATQTPATGTAVIFIPITSTATTQTLVTSTVAVQTLVTTTAAILILVTNTDDTQSLMISTTTIQTPSRGDTTEPENQSMLVGISCPDVQEEMEMKNNLLSEGR